MAIRPADFLVWQYAGLQSETGANSKALSRIFGQRDNMEPLVSILMPVYNAENTLERAILSILNQTYNNLEFIIINDGSKDSSPEIIASFQDERIRVLHQEKNRGIVAALNRGIRESRGNYLARIDADDMALPERIAKQVEFMENHPGIGVLGTATKVVYGDGTSMVRQLPQDHAAIKKNIIRICPFIHSSVMMRRKALDNVGLYDPAYDGTRRVLVADYDLWVRMLAAGVGMANLPEVLIVTYRQPNSILMKRSFGKRLTQRILSRHDIIKRLGLGYLAYLSIFPVIIISILIHYNIKIDPIYNFLSRNNPEIDSRGLQHVIDET